MPAPGVPDRTPPVDSVTADGREPDSVQVAVGKPVSLAVNWPKVARVNVVLAADVTVGDWPTVKVNASVAEPSTLAAVTVIEYVPVADAVPDKTPPADRLIPDGSDPVSEKVGDGSPDAPMLNDLGVPMANVATSAPSKDGAAKELAK